MSTINKHELQELTAKAAVVQLTSVEQRRLQNLVAEAEGHDSTDPEHREQKYNRAFRHFLSTGAGLSQFSFDRSDGLGKDVLTLAERSILRAREISASNMYLDSESRDMAEGSGAYSIGSMGGAYSGSTSGYFASLEFNSQVTSALRSYGGVLSEAALIDAPDGRIRAYPTDSDATASGEMLTEGRQTTQQDLSINQILVGAYKFSSKCLKISRELCADSGIDLQSYLTERLGIRLARTMNDRFTNGLGGGNSEPNGLIHSSPIGAVAVGSASNTGGA